MTAEVPFFDFDELAPTEDDKAALPPACQFKMGGETWTVRNKELVSFDAMFAVTAVTEAGVPIAVRPFFSGVLEPSQVEAFFEVVARPDITLPMVREAMTRIVAALQGRPTKPSATSASGSKRTSRKSAGGSSSAATRQPASAG